MHVSYLDAPLADLLCLAFRLCPLEWCSERPAPIRQCETKRVYQCSYKRPICLRLNRKDLVCAVADTGLPYHLIRCRNAYAMVFEVRKAFVADRYSQ